MRGVARYLSWNYWSGFSAGVPPRPVGAFRAPNARLSLPREEAANGGRDLVAGQAVEVPEAVAMDQVERRPPIVECGGEAVVESRRGGEKRLQCRSADFE